MFSVIEPVLSESCHIYFSRGWKCSKCDMVENLWMNLTDGTILCGRRYFDGLSWLLFSL